MIELTMLNYLDSALDAPVYMEKPREPEADKYVVLEKVGSAKMNHVSSATIAAQSYAASLYEAAELNETVKGAIEGAVSLDEISAVRLNSDYNFTDPETKQYRYQCLYVITYGG